MDDEQVRTIKVEFWHELGAWHFHVDEPRIIGGGQTSLRDVCPAAAEAIEFALEGE